MNSVFSETIFVWKLSFTSNEKSLPGNFFTISLKNRAGKTIDPVDWTIRSSFTGI